MKVALASDHRGDAAGAALAEHLRAAGHEVLMLGETGPESRDYPVSAWLVGRAVADGEADAGVLLCGSGNGIAIAANKIAGVRAAVGYDAHAVEMSRRHNDANVLCLAADSTPADEIIAWVTTWIATPFEGGRHARRVKQISDIEHGRAPATNDHAPTAS